MAKLEEIFISGIRSYGINKTDAQILTFSSPVTLFLGQNGCGKTTIIEAVKHALTGEFPFSGKTGGQTFVADPHLYNVHSVKGCIKLKFRDVYGKPAIISRSLKLEALGTKFKCTSLDASYSYIDKDNTKRERCVKLNDCKDMIRMLIGVSEAVLSNVLFCHQEDSMWPLGEDGAVKKKFDQIFDSSKYDQTVDHLTKSIKARAISLKNLQKELVFLTEMKNTALEKRQKLKDKKESLDLLNKETAEMRTRYTPLKAKLDDLLSLEGSLSELYKMKSENEHKLASNRDYQRDLRSILKSEFEGSDEQLEHEIINFEACVKQKRDELQRIEAKISQGQSQLKKNGIEVQDRRSAMATVQEKIKGYNTRINERDESVKSLLIELKATPKEGFKANHAEIKASLEMKRKEFSNTESDLEQFENSVQQDLDAAQVKLMQERSRETLKHQEKQAALDEKRNIEGQLEDLSSSETEFKSFETKMKRLQDEINSIQSSFNAESAERTIFQNKKQMRVLTDSLEDYNHEMQIYFRNAMIEKEMEHHQADKTSKTKEIRNIRNKYHKQLSTLFDDNVAMEQLKTEIEKRRENNTRMLQEQRRDLMAKEKISKSLNAQLSVEKHTLDTNERELENAQRAIGKFCTVENFETTIKEVEEKNCNLQKEKGQLDAFKIIYKDFVNSFAEKKCCPVCETDFSTKHTKVKHLTNNMNEKIQRTPEKLNAVTAKLEASEKLYNELTQLKPVYLKLTKLKSDLEEKRELLKTSNEKNVEIEKELVDLKTKIDETQNTLDICTKLAPYAALIDQYSGDIVKATAKLTELNRKLEPTGSNRTKAETEMLIESTKEEMAKLTDESERLNKKIATNQKRLYDLRTQKSDLLETQSKLQRLLNDKPQLILKQVELEKKIEDLTNIMETIENDSLAAFAEVEEVKSRLTSVKREHARTLNEMRTMLQRHESSYNDITKLMREIQLLEKQNLQGRCSDIEEQISQLNVTRNQIEEELSNSNKKRENLKEDLHDQDSTDKSLQNNKKLRDLMKVEVKLIEKIKSYAAEIGNKNYGNIEAEKHKLQKEINVVCTDLAKIEGQVKSLKDNIQELTKELDNCKTDPIKTYRDRVIEIKLEEMVIQDMRRLTECMSAAICKYHREQLLSLNLRLRDMWRSIYKGNDIDYIQIESGETQLTATRRQYSYCLVQKKGDVMMPMRGKCSAGQKVLACLLVRIVLAEHFSVDCGIFALDEPTTNLDRENIRSLSQAIARLINSRRGQKNFQFLIITHDEEFLDALREVDAVKEFYRVSRNYKGNTVVKMEEI